MEEPTFRTKLKTVETLSEDEDEKPLTWVRAEKPAKMKSRRGPAELLGFGHGKEEKAAVLRTWDGGSAEDLG